MWMYLILLFSSIKFAIISVCIRERDLLI